jgi:hypothetical protein
MKDQAMNKLPNARSTRATPSAIGSRFPHERSGRSSKKLPGHQQDTKIREIRLFTLFTKKHTSFLFQPQSGKSSVLPKRPNGSCNSLNYETNPPENSKTTPV